MKHSAGPTAPTEAPRQPMTVLDPCTLGRPVHLLGAFTALLQADLAAYLRTEFNRRYRAAFEVTGLTFERRPLTPLPARWLGYTTTTGCVGFGLDRTLLLALLAYRYGQPGGADLHAPVRETATEERLAGTLGQRLLRLLAGRIDAGLQPAAGAADETFKPLPNAATGPWTVQVDVHESQLDLRARLWFCLDDAWMARLLRRLAPVRERTSEAGTPSGPLAARLQLTLAGRLLQKELPLGELMQLRSGDVIPISLGPTDVLVDDSRLFTATVAEHKGKLCLTSFEPVE